MLIRKQGILKRGTVCLIYAALCACYHPPYNNFRPYNPTLKSMGKGAAIGTVIGAAAGSTLIGTGVGAATLTARTLYSENKNSVIRDLQKVDIQFEQYGDTKTLIVPTDRYYLFNSPRLNELCYPGLTLIIKLLRFYPNSVIYIAGFTDNIGSRYHKKMLTQARAEAMLTYLWANGIPAQRLTAEGYSDKHTVSDNKIIHGSAQNRRIEIQWFTPTAQSTPVIPYLGPTK